MQEHHFPATENNTLVKAFRQNLENEIDGYQKYLTSIEVCSNRELERGEFQQIMSDIHAIQRKELFKMRKEKIFTDEAIRKAENILDINDLKISGGS